MELHISTVLPTRNSFSVLNFPSKNPTHVSIISQPRLGFSNSSLRFANFPIKCTSHQLEDSHPDQQEEEGTEKEVNKKKAKTLDWRSVFLGETSIATNSAQLDKKKVKGKSVYVDEPGSMDWCVRARKYALKSIEERGFSYRLQRMVTPKKKKKKRKSTRGKFGKMDLAGVGRILDKLDSRDRQEEEEDDDDAELFTIDLDDDEEGEEEVSSKSDQNTLKTSIEQFADGYFEEKRAKAKEAFVQRLSQFSGPSNVKMEISLNKCIVKARTAEEVLEVISDVITSVAKGLSPSPVSPLNVATALHRIAKNMEKVQMIQTRRLGFARQREMSLLVGIAMTALPNCSAQGVSNIAWALSKIGGDLLYQSEMDRIADIAITKIDEFNAQNVANVALAYATMRHSSPDLFAKLVCRATELVETFNEQELTQFLWACATLNVYTDPFLDVLDTVFDKQVGLVSDSENDKEIEGEIENEVSSESLEDTEDLKEIEDEIDNEFSAESLEDLEVLKEIEDETSESLEDIEDWDSLDNFLASVSSYDEPHVTYALNFTRDQIGNLAWSYAVLGQTGRPLFSNIWSILTQLVQKGVSDQFREDVLFASQVYIANQCLKIENSNSGLALEGELEEKIYSVGQTKRFNIKSTSLFQKEVGRLLVATGLNWMREYSVDGYTVDAVLVDEKVAFEIDGPSHFSRNLATPLGHTMMKRRYITAAGWKLVSLSYNEWATLKGEFEQLEYLRKILGINEDVSFDEA
ncbi:hypothetical protein LUZ62_049620 [Rhynchospora pubera]|uniref:RAP domain-containing protein n=1 Tax=Rhynchospora pubera TaxID=906938 RepID=A0AAV8FZQ1_9POAL|nr:hypothetical protein LUZ62_049620 [Rhynchospora pubera]